MFIIYSYVRVVLEYTCLDQFEVAIQGSVVAPNKTKIKKMCVFPNYFNY